MKFGTEYFQVGNYPWRPHENAVEEEILHFYDIPLVGTFSIGTSYWLYSIDSDELDASQSCWNYTSLTKEQAAELQNSQWDTTQDFWESIREIEESNGIRFRGTAYFDRLGMVSYV